MRGKVWELGNRKLADNIPSAAMPALDAARRKASDLLYVREVVYRPLRA